MACALTTRRARRSRAQGAARGRPGATCVLVQQVVEVLGAGYGGDAAGGQAAAVLLGDGGVAREALLVELREDPAQEVVGFNLRRVFNLLEL